MAKAQVEAAVQSALEARSIELSASALVQIRRRVAEADESALDSAVMQDGVVMVTRADAMAVVDENVERLATALRGVGDGPYTAEQLANALAGLCPIWPFC